MRRHVIRGVLAILLSAPFASAQTPEITVVSTTPAAEFGAALTMQSPPDVNGRPQCVMRSLPCASGKEFGDVGWSLSTAYNFTEQVGLVGEVAAFDNTWLEAGRSRDSVNHVHSFMGGPRAASPFKRSGAANPNDTRLFLQLMAGVQVSDLTPTRLALRPGGGLDILTRTGLIVRLGLDYTFTSAEGRDLSGSRFVIGLVVGAGAK
jgi:hypothetical protein